MANKYPEATAIAQFVCDTAFRLESNRQGKTLMELSVVPKIPLLMTGEAMEYFLREEAFPDGTPVYVICEDTYPVFQEMEEVEIEGYRICYYKRQDTIHFLISKVGAKAKLSASRTDTPASLLYTIDFLEKLLEIVYSDENE